MVVLRDLPSLAVHIVDVLLKKYGPQVLLVTITGSVAEYIYTEYSGIDIWLFLEDFEKSDWANNLSRFLIEGTVINLTPITFKELKQRSRDTGAPNWLTVNSAIVNSKIIYAQKNDVLNQFLQLQNEMNTPSETPKEEKERFLSVMFRNLMMQHKAITEHNEILIRQTLWGLFGQLFHILARLNDTKLPGNWDRDFSVILDFDLLPDNFETTINELLNEQDPWVIFTKSMLLIESTLSLFDPPSTSPLSREEVDFDNNYYLDILSKVNKLKSAMRRENLMEYDHQLIQLQGAITVLSSHDIIDHNSLNRIQYPSMRLDVISDELVSNRMEQLDHFMMVLKQYYEENGIGIMEFETLSEWETFLEL